MDINKSEETHKNTKKLKVKVFYVQLKCLSSVFFNCRRNYKF